MGNPEHSKIIVCHLDNVSSLSAVMDGKVYDTSMVLTPMDVLMMRTRYGDIDPDAGPFLIKKENLTTNQVDMLMNKQSGLLGISGLNSDMRDVKPAA